jgi:hypothetical protein
MENFKAKTMRTTKRKADLNKGGWTEYTLGDGRTEYSVEDQDTGLSASGY